MELALSIICGLLIGIVGTIGVQSLNEENESAALNTQQEIIKQLTENDIIAPICSKSYLEKNGPLLCRELTCLQFTRGIDSKTGGSQCETISNIQNTKIIRKECTDEDPAKKQACIDLFWRRK